MKRKIHAVITGMHRDDAFSGEPSLIGKKITFDRLASKKEFINPKREQVMTTSHISGYFAGLADVEGKRIACNFYAIQFDIIKPPKRKRIKNEQREE